MSKASRKLLKALELLEDYFTKSWAKTTAGFAKDGVNASLTSDLEYKVQKSTCTLNLMTTVLIS